MSEGGEPNAQDTNLQRRLQAKLRESGWLTPWREYLVQMSEAGRSGQEIAWILRQEFDVRINQATACRWLQQAREETSRMPDRELV